MNSVCGKAVPSSIFTFRRASQAPPSAVGAVHAYRPDSTLSSFGMTSRRNQARSWPAPPGFSRFHWRPRRRCSTIASPRLRFVSASARASLPASVCRRSASRARSITRRPRSRRACGAQPSQWRRRRFSTALPQRTQATGTSGGDSGGETPQALLAYQPIPTKGLPPKCSAGRTS